MVTVESFPMFAFDCGKREGVREREKEGGERRDGEIGINSVKKKMEDYNHSQR